MFETQGSSVPVFAAYHSQQQDILHTLSAQGILVPVPSPPPQSSYRSHSSPRI